MSIEYRYHFSITINAPIQLVTQLIIDDEKMVEWQEGLSNIEKIKGKNHENGSERILHFKNQNQAIKMKEIIELNDLPEHLIQIYELGPVWNQCDQYFQAQGHETLWSMDVIFRFEYDPPALKETFKTKTYQWMLAFKNFVEAKKKSYKD